MDMSSTSSSSPFGDIPSRREDAVAELLGSTPILYGGGYGGGYGGSYPYEDTSGSGLETEVIDMSSTSSSSPFGDIPSRREDAVAGLLGSTPILCGGGYGGGYGGSYPYEDTSGSGLETQVID